MQTPIQAATVYTDVSGLNSIKELGRKDRSAAIDKIASQFESVFIGQMLKGMRDANASFVDSGMFSGWEMQMRQQMFDQQISLSLSEGKGMGLAAVIARQMKQQLPEGQRATELEQAALPTLKPIERTYLPQAHSIDAEIRSAVPRELPEVSAQPAEAQPTNFSNPDDYVQFMQPFASEAGSKLGIEPRILLAQSALETGWGSAIISDNEGKSSHNLFNIKAGKDWQGPSMTVVTLEYREGVAVRERHNFRAYDSYQESFDDYVDFIRNSARYGEALAVRDRPAEYMSRLQEAGYATDPEYASKITHLFNESVISAAGAQL